MRSVGSKRCAEADASGITVCCEAQYAQRVYARA